MSAAELPESESGERLRQLEDEHAELTRSLLSLTTHFAQVQFRLKQIVGAEPEEREKLLRSLEQVAFNGCPDVRTREESRTLVELLGEKDYEERLRDQKTKQQQLIHQLQLQLQELEQHSIDSQQRATDLQARFDPDLAERQRVLIDELKSRLNINIDIVNSMSADEVGQIVDTAVHEVTRPARTKEQQIRILASQVEDLERYVVFLKEHSGNRVGNQEVVTKEPKRRVTRTFGSATRGSKVSADHRRHSRHRAAAPPTAAGETASSSESGNNDSEYDGDSEESVFQKKTKKLLDKDDDYFSESRRQSALREIAVSGLQWMQCLLCGIGAVSQRRVDETRIHTRRALCGKVTVAVDSILTLVASEAHCSTEDDVQTGTVAQSAELTRLARLSLGNALMDVFHNGLIEPLIGAGLVPGWHALSCTVVPSDSISATRSREHVWLVFEQFYALKKGHEYNSTPARTLSSAFKVTLEGGTAVTPRQRLFDDMMNIQRSHEAAYKSADVKFRSLVCAGMNHGLLAVWCNMIVACSELMSRHYQSWACIQMDLEGLIRDLERLSQLKFQLSLEPPARLASDIEDVVSSPR